MSSTINGGTSGVPMTRQNRINILRRAREILSKPERWMRTALADTNEPGKQTKFCLVGALEQAVYDLGLRAPVNGGFRGPVPADAQGLDAYKLSEDIQLTGYSKKTYGKEPWSINDRGGYEKTVELLDEFIAEVEKR